MGLQFLDSVTIKVILIVWSAWSEELIADILKAGADLDG